MTVEQHQLLVAYEAAHHRKLLRKARNGAYFGLETASGEQKALAFHFQAALVLLDVRDAL